MPLFSKWLVSHPYSVFHYIFVKIDTILRLQSHKKLFFQFLQTKNSSKQTTSFPSGQVLKCASSSITEVYPKDTYYVSPRVKTSWTKQRVLALQTASSESQKAGLS